MTQANPIITLKAKIKEFGFSKLKADKNNKAANSGETMYLDLPRMNFVINGKIIDKVFTCALMEGAKHRKSNLSAGKTTPSLHRVRDRVSKRAFLKLRRQETPLLFINQQLIHNVL
jgi:hypothetical protein